jgi:hypothetical protein
MKMIKKSEGRAEADLIRDISSLAERKVDQVTAEIYLTGVMKALRAKDQDIETATPFIRGSLLQRITRREGKRKKAVELTIQLIGYVGEYEAAYLSDFLSRMEADFQDEGRSWLEKKTQLISCLTKLSNSLDGKSLTKDADKVDLIARELISQDD